MNTRYIQSIVETAQTSDVTMPWHRKLRAERRAPKQDLRARLVTPAPRNALTWAA